MNWFYAAPALHGEALLHWAGQYRVDELERALRVDAACGFSLALPAARFVVAPARGAVRCPRCVQRSQGRQIRQGSSGRRAP